MVKLALFQLLTILGLLTMAQTGYVAVHELYWGDLGIIEQIRLTSGLIFIISVGIAASIIFRSVWIKNGYAGEDLILVDKEVALFMSHVLAFCLLEIFFFMILFYKYTQPPEYAFWICGAGFLSPEVVQVLHFIMDRVKSIKKDKE